MAVRRALHPNERRRGFQFTLSSSNGYIELDVLEFVKGDCRVKVTAFVEPAPRMGGLSVEGWNKVWLDQDNLDKIASDLPALVRERKGTAHLSAMSADEFELELRPGEKPDRADGRFSFGRGGQVKREPVDLDTSYHEDIVQFTGDLSIWVAHAQEFVAELTTYVVPGDGS